MSRSICRIAPLVIAGVITGLLAIPAVSSAANTCNVSGQSNLSTLLVLRLAVTGTSCKNARTVTWAFHRCRYVKGRRGTCGTKVLGYSCRERRFDQNSLSFDGSVTCKRGRVLIKHTYLQRT